MDKSKNSVGGAKHKVYRKPLVQLANRLITDGASEWNVSRRSVVAILCAPVFVALTGVLAGLIDKDTYKWFTGEDGFAENLQVLFYCLALVLSLAIIRRLWRETRKGVALLYACVSLGLIFLIGEELSWGQRIFEWETPESLSVMNKQEETNLHNIYGVGTAFKWIQLLVGAYGTLLPVLVLLWDIPPRFRYAVSMIVPHYTLIPCFMFMFLWKLYRNLFETPKGFYFVISEFNEVIELMLAMGFFLFMLFQWRKMKLTSYGHGTKTPGSSSDLRR